MYTNPLDALYMMHTSEIIYLFFSFHLTWLGIVK